MAHRRTIISAVQGFTANAVNTDDRTRRLLPALLLVVILAGGCTGSNDGDRTAEPATTTITEPPTSTERPDDTISPAVPARVQLDWAVANLISGRQVTVEEVEERFSPTFLRLVPADQVIAAPAVLFDFAEPPFTVERFEAGGDGLTGEAVLLGSDGRRLSAQIVVAADAPHLIDGVVFEPTELEFPVPINVTAIDDRLAELAPRSSLGVYDVTDGSCKAVHEIRTDTTIVLGSVFKLWVLAALANEIDEGRAGWDETVVVTDELRSSPNGEIYELETGSEVTLQHLAEAMISISDNTATDLLLDRLGRETVEATLERAGVADPAANVPMLSTGNLFALKFLADAPNAADYRVLDEAGQRSLLDELDEAIYPWVGSGMWLSEVAESKNADGVPIDDPRDLDVEWFATAEDLCRTLVHLDELAETPGLEPVASILEINPGAWIPFDRDRWPSIRYKGGEEPGVTAGAWWFETPDGDRYVVAGGVANPDTAHRTLDALLILASAVELIE